VVQAFLEIDALEKKGVSAETEFAKAEKLISEAMGVIDSAKVKGVLHSNTADRRKSKLARYKTRALERLGLYTPAN
jgi:ribosomal protein S20